MTKRILLLSLLLAALTSGCGDPGGSTAPELEPDAPSPEVEMIPDAIEDTPRDPEDAEALEDTSEPEDIIEDTFDADEPEEDTGLPDVEEPPRRCAPLPLACGEVEPEAITEHRMSSLGDGCAFGLTLTEGPEEGRDIMDAIAPITGGYRTLSEVLGDLNREGVPGITAQSATRLRNHPHLGFRWNSGDMDTLDWYPQGMTGGSDRQQDGRPEGRRLLLVSWYDHRDTLPSKGVRLALIDFTDPQAPAYRLILLVTPRRQGELDTYGPVVVANGGPLHAGGIAWVGDLLYVADTTEGFRVFDMSRLVEANVFDRDRIGVDGGELHAHGYKYFVPQIARYRLAPGSCAVRFSFAGLDRGASTLVSGEYHRSDTLGRVVSWPIELEGGWLEEEAGVVRAIEAVAGAQTKMQGGLTVDGNHYISSSSQAGNFGRLYRTRPGRESSISAWVYGAEDLYYERDTNRIWTCAEHPGTRDTLSILRLDP